MGIELVRQILVSSILSPNDMTKVSLHFSVEDSPLDAELNGQLVDVITKYFDRTYKIKKLLPNILSECLFEKGSYPLMTLPSTAIDDIINNPSRVSIESVATDFNIKGEVTGLGIIGKPTTLDKSKTSDVGLSLESFSSVSRNNHHETDYAISKHLTVTDNPIVLKLPMVLDRMR